MHHAFLILYLVAFFSVSSRANPQYENEAERIRAEYINLIRNKNCPGTVAADFSFVTGDSVATNLHTLASDKNLIVLFYDPECDHCVETIGEMKYLPWVDSCRILAVDIADDKEVWNSMQSMLPGNWISAFATDPLEDEEMYVFEEIPTLYLLAPDKRVILKDATLPEITEYFNSSDSQDDI